MFVDSEAHSGSTHYLLGWRKNVYAAARKIHVEEFPSLIRRFLYRVFFPEAPSSSQDLSITACPLFEGYVSAYASATSIFFAPSDPSGLTGLRKEHIRATPRWRSGPARYDCIFVTNGAQASRTGFRGLRVARLRLIFSFQYKATTYRCALVHWYDPVGDQPDDNTGMWMVRPSIDAELEGAPNLAIIHLSEIFRAAHLLPVFGEAPVPVELSYSDSLNVFQTFYVNKYIDHHAFEIAA